MGYGLWAMGWVAGLNRSTEEDSIARRYRPWPIAHSPQPHSDYDDFFRDLARLPFRRPPLLGGTFAPFFLASDNPMAIACSRLLTFPPRPDLPDLRVPRLRRRMALSTLLLAPLPYLLRLLLRDDRLRAAIRTSRKGRSQTK